ncbi:hydrogenase 3 maturation endopeptidase HyCI [candidate division KSB1 bacterium]|nr:hydrogenase 3 maturation endopeptidase HyCI [candidate division KSB1 bacterium]
MSLEQQLRDILANRKVVLLGVGNPDRGDDGLGPALVKKIGAIEYITCINCERVPENYTGVVREARPDVILFVDAIDFTGKPGEVVLLQSDAMQQEQRCNTHHPALSLVMDYLTGETGAQVWLLGVQPKSTTHGEPLTPEIDEVLNQLAFMLHKIADEDRV